MHMHMRMDVYVYVHVHARVPACRYASTGSSQSRLAAQQVDGRQSGRPLHSDAALLDESYLTNAVSDLHALTAHEDPTCPCP